MALLLHNKEKLQKYIDVFDGQTINGMYISESGILMMTHLGDGGLSKDTLKMEKYLKMDSEQKSHRTWINLVGTILN